MDYNEFKEKYVDKFNHIDHVFWPDKGYIVWRVGTGENVELLHIGTFTQRKGYAKELVREMLNQLKNKPPYYSIFGFALSSRSHLKEIYQKLGFNTTEELPAPYKSGGAIIFWQDYNTLVKRYLAE